jgi:hypothetical protein
MKKITEMSHDEIIALDRDDIERLIDIACAETGIPLRDLAPVAPVEPKSERGLNSYKIINVVFKTRESAEALQDCLRKNFRNILRMDYSKPSEYRLKIEDYAYSTDEEIKAQNKEDELYNKEFAEYKALKDKYDTHLAQRQEVADPILDIYNEAVAKEQVRQMLQRESGRYLDLAEGNVEIAVNFLKSTFPDALEKVKDIFNPLDYMTDIYRELQDCVLETPQEAKCLQSKN